MTEFKEAVEENELEIDCETEECEEHLVDDHNYFLVDGEASDVFQIYGVAIFACLIAAYLSFFLINTLRGYRQWKS